MSKSMKSGVLGVLIGVIIAVAAVFIFNSIKQPKDKCQICGTVLNEGKCPNICPKCNKEHLMDWTCKNCDREKEGAGDMNDPDRPKKDSDRPINAEPTVPPQPDPKKDNVGPLQPQEKKPVPTSAVERIVPRILKAEFAMKGRGYDAKWGIGKEANFQYTVYVEAQSEILSKKTLPTGRIEVNEKRTFLKVYDTVVTSDVDFILALDTLPMQEFSKAIDATSMIISSMNGRPELGAVVVGVKNNLMQKLQDVNGKGLRALLGWCGLKPANDIEQKLQALAGSQLTKAIGGIRSISGKSYLVYYMQEESGQPLMVDFKNEDGSDVTDEEEQMVLKRVNAFIDYHLVPNKNCVPGDNWTVYAENMQELFDPFVDGRYNGKINVVRKSDAEDGDWRVVMRPGTVNVIGDGGTTTGSLRIESGEAKFDPKNVSLNDMLVEGRAKMEKLKRHHWLFTAKINGDCEFQARAITEPLKK